MPLKTFPPEKSRLQNGRREYACKFKSTTAISRAFINFLFHFAKEKPCQLCFLKRTLRKVRFTLKIESAKNLKTRSSLFVLEIPESTIRAKIRNRRQRTRKRMKTEEIRRRETTSGAFWNGTCFVTLACAPCTCAVVNAIVHEGPRQRQKEEEEEEKWTTEGDEEGPRHRRRQRVARDLGGPKSVTIFAGRSSGLTQVWTDRAVP